MNWMLPAIPDEHFQRGDVPMTKQEIRVYLMAQAMIQPQDVIWDIGAGTGSLTVESALRASAGQVVAVEVEEEACELVRKNSAQFHLPNVTVVQAKAPQGLAELPDPDVVFVGGSGGNLRQILTLASQRLRPGGRLIITAVLVETLQETLNFTDSLTDFTVESCGLQITQVQPVGRRHMLKALNPIYIVVCRKGGCV
jgi:precorrin-6Y C5,15-methyltransferase (decarboxylating) CbiT subunit